MVTITFHKDLTLEKWAAKPLSWQILNIASELGRTESSLKSRLGEPFRASLERALELIDLTVEVNLQAGEFVRELLRFREVLEEIYVTPVLPDTSEFRSLTKVLLTLDPGAYNLLGITF